eukprot:g52235.t1
MRYADIYGYTYITTMASHRKRTSIFAVESSVSKVTMQCGRTACLDISVRRFVDKYQAVIVLYHVSITIVIFLREDDDMMSLRIV